jgi:hypothetical protein
MSHLPFGARVLLRLFGLVIGIVSTGYFVFAFWLMIKGVTFSIFEPNILVSTLELLMAIGGLGVLFVRLIAEMIGWR